MSYMTDSNEARVQRNIYPHEYEMMVTAIETASTPQEPTPSEFFFMPARVEVHTPNSKGEAPLTT